MNEDKIPPSHPGVFLLEDFMEPYGITEQRLARDTGIQLGDIKDLIKGNRALTPNIAMRLARYFCTRESYWLTLQAGYELELEKDLVGDQVEKEVMALDDAVRHMAEAEKTIKIPAYRAPKGDRMLREAERCDLCSGSLEPGKTKLEFWLGEQLVVVQDMPADVCRRCGEAYLSYINSASLDRLRSKSDKPEPEQFLSVPVYSAQRLLGTKSQA
jgi:addiction module HigA family antidote